VALNPVRGIPPADDGADQDATVSLRLPDAGACLRRVRDDQVDEVLLTVWEGGADQPAIRGQRALPEVWGLAVVNDAAWRNLIDAAPHNGMHPSQLGAAREVLTVREVDEPRPHDHSFRRVLVGAASPLYVRSLSSPQQPVGGRVHRPPGYPHGIRHHSPGQAALGRCPFSQLHTGEK
jgi:hypothetical protein